MIGAVSWITTISLQMQEKDEESEQKNQLEENIRLSLWRLDSLLNSFVREENARPYTDYKEGEKPRAIAL